jgi:cellulose biosynthesis protein BcsQ
MAETIAVLSLKGGTGKTTTVRTLADVFRRIGLDVLTVDLDPQGNLSDYFNVPGDASPTTSRATRRPRRRRTTASCRRRRSWRRWSAG